eukprot:CAMPEP_0196594268 /NCGR_PEP_ID=MMETSP1081-20130531/77815_1 /TAXON_ID=36882 /ORGANISM="Pyramimonas amylifera, Strain CCMP720" /LENGTH=489 /DNA_ID=CAMNT_0041918479 /DNA_START=387 /DNA_END=1856 /DNA_ORIENTATION=+
MLNIVVSDESVVVNDIKDSGYNKLAVATAFFFPAIGGLLFGYDIGATSGAMISISSEALSGTDWYSLSPLATGLIVSGSLAGALAASATALVYGDVLGRRNELLIAAGLYGSGALLMGAAPSLELLVLGRLVYGAGIGFAMHGAPIYIAETAPASLRGTLISLKEGFIVGGILLGYLACSVLIGQEGGWRSIYSLSLVPAALLAGGMFYLPESPRWLLLSGAEPREAEIALRTLRGKVEDPSLVTAETDAMLVGSEASKQSDVGGSMLPKLLNNSKALYAGISLVLFQQITGQPSVLYYATEIFQKAGFDAAEDATKISVLLGIFKLGMTFVAVSTVDSLGRRPLLLVGVSCLVVALLALAGIQVLPSDLAEGAGVFLPWYSVAALLLYVGAYQVSFGPIAWLIIGEVFPVEIRSAAVGLATITNFGSNFLVSLLLPTLQDEFGPAGTYFVFAVLGLVAITSIYFTLPETKGKTLEEIQDEFSSSKIED